MNDLIKSFFRMTNEPQTESQTRQSHDEDQGIREMEVPVECTEMLDRCRKTNYEVDEILK